MAFKVSMLLSIFLEWVYKPYKEVEPEVFPNHQWDTCNNEESHEANHQDNVRQATGRGRTRCGGKEPVVGILLTVTRTIQAG